VSENTTEARTFAGDEMRGRFIVGEENKQSEISRIKRGLPSREPRSFVRCPPTTARVRKLARARGAHDRANLERPAPAGPRVILRPATYVS
jgi:hypothetical protein